MFKKANLMFLYTETSLHAGSGTSLGVVDLPIQREKYTDFPVIQASGVKGAIREWFEFQDKDNKDKRKLELTFGPETIGSEESGYAAAITFTDARILLFPVRTLKGIFAYCTSPPHLSVSAVTRSLPGSCLTGRYQYQRMMKLCLGSKMAATWLRAVRC